MLIRCNYRRTRAGLWPAKPPDGRPCCVRGLALRAATPGTLVLPKPGSCLWLFPKARGRSLAKASSRDGSAPARDEAPSGGARTRRATRGFRHRRGASEGPNSSPCQKHANSAEIPAPARRYRSVLRYAVIPNVKRLDGQASRFITHCHLVILLTHCDHETTFSGKGRKEAAVPSIGVKGTAGMRETGRRRESTPRSA